MSSVENTLPDDLSFQSEEVARCPWPYFAALREQAPVHRVPGRDVYEVARYEDVRAVSTDFETFSSKRAWLTESLGPETREILADAWPERDVLAGEDPPAQTRNRKLVGYAFTPKRMKVLSDQVYAYANDLVDAFVERGEVDFVAEYANVLPTQVIASLLGVPFEDHERLWNWVRDYMEWTAKALAPLTVERERECARSIVEFQRYAAAQLERLRKNPGENLLSDLARADEAVDEGTMVDIARSVLLAGVETTRGLLSGEVLYLLQHPDQLAKVQADRSLIPGAVEEALRFESPAQRGSRVLTRDAEIAGCPLPAGTYLQLLYGAANRDESAFDRAEEFDVARSPNQHMAFGLGRHFCIGAPLARLEGVATLDVVLSRLKNLRLAPDHAELEYQPNPLMRILKHLHLEWDPE